MKLFLLFVLYATVAIAQGTYSMKDLQVLIDTKEYSEALRHMKDIPPTQRNEDWKKMATSAALAVIELESTKERGCSSAYRLSQNLSTEYAFFDENPEYKNLKIKVGACQIKKREFYDRKDMLKVVEDLVKLDENTIYTLVLDANFDDTSRIFLKYLDKNSSKYLKDDKVKTYLMSAVTENFTNDDEAINDLKTSLIKKFQLKENLNKDFTKRMKKIADEIVVGDFTNDYKGMSILVSLKNLSMPIEGVAYAEYLLAQLIVGIRNHENILPYLEKMNDKDLQAGEKSLISSKPERPFWFSGGGWDQDDKMQNVKRYLKGIISVAKKECADHEKDEKSELKHVAHNCPIIKTL